MLCAGASRQSHYVFEACKAYAEIVHSASKHQSALGDHATSSSNEAYVLFG